MRFRHQIRAFQSLKRSFLESTGQFYEIWGEKSKKTQKTTRQQQTPKKHKAREEKMPKKYQKIQKREGKIPN